MEMGLDQDDYDSLLDITGPRMSMSLALLRSVLKTGSSRVTAAMVDLVRSRICLR